jgi:hypothetical protein
MPLIYEEALLMCIRCLSKYSRQFIDCFRVLFFLSNLYGKHIKKNLGFSNMKNLGNLYVGCLEGFKQFFIFFELESFDFPFMIIFKIDQFYFLKFEVLVIMTLV